MQHHFPHYSMLTSCESYPFFVKNQCWFMDNQIIWNRRPTQRPCLRRCIDISVCFTWGRAWLAECFELSHQARVHQRHRLLTCSARTFFLSVKFARSRPVGRCGTQARCLMHHHNHSGHHRGNHANHYNHHSDEHHHRLNPGLANRKKNLMLQTCPSQRKERVCYK